VEFRILGPLEIVGDAGAVEMTGGKRQALLGLLLLHAGRIVAMDRFVDGLWGEEVPESAQKMVQIYISQLRKELPKGLIQTRPPGYLLSLDGHSLDLDEFDRLQRAGREALSHGRVGEAAETLRRALGLWRGLPLAEFEEPFAQMERARLAEQRLTCLEERIEAELELGKHAELIAELESLVRHHPLRERLRGQLMLALYRCGRHAEALESYQTFRRKLAEFGIDPPPRLKELERRMLQQDPSLTPPELTAAGPNATGTRGFVGRERELARLEAALPLRQGAVGGALLVVGAPGIGKTRLLEELAARARNAGVRVAWGRSHAGEAAPPYWPWREVLRSLAQESAAQNAAEADEDSVSGLARLVPEVAERFGRGRSQPPDDDPQQARFDLFDSVTSFLLRTTDRDPLLVVLDDLHAADGDSLSLLAFLARRLRDSRLVVAATIRDDEPPLNHPLAEALAALRRSELATVAVGGLARSALAGLVELHTGSRPPDELIAELHATTEGNPLFVSEVIRLALEEQPDGTLGGELLERFREALPGGVRSAIAARIGSASAACRAVLVAAALLGAELTVARLRAVAALDSAELVLDGIEEAVADSLLTEQPGHVGRYELAHALVREAVLAQLPATRRARLHLRAADALEQHYGPDAEAHAAEIAYHLDEAGAVAAPARLVRFCSLGAARALRLEAYHEAQRLFDRALAAKHGQPIDDDTAELSTGLARAELATLGLHDMDTFRQATGRMQLAFDHYVATGSIPRAIAAATLPIPRMYRTTSAAEYRELTLQALALADPDSLAAGRLLEATGWFAGVNEFDLETASSSFETAIAIARRHHDAALELRTLLSAAMVEFQHTQWAESRRAAGAALQLVRHAEDPQAEAFACIWAARGALVLGDSASAREHVSTSLPLAERLEDPYSLNGVFLNATWLAMLEGRWDAARSAAARALAAEPNDTRVVACSALVEYQCGDRSSGDELVARLLEAWSATADAPHAVGHNIVTLFLPLLGRIAPQGDQARSIAAEAAATARSAGVIHPLSSIHIHAGLGLIAAADGDPAGAAAAYEELKSQAGTAFVVAALSGDRLLGLLAQTRGDTDAAERHLEDALAFCRKAHYRSEWAWAAHDYATLPARAGRQALLDEAHEIASELGMVALTERLRQLAAARP
jgi:DNA-binding SARP family transcriptional activator